ncbi:MAG: SDR family NAD(P)-dependent oxidoreductase [Pseudomonadota bacterium]
MSSDSFLIKYGPWALVTGASDGIGRAVAGKLAARGLNLLLVGRRIERLSTLSDKIARDHGVEVIPISADLGSMAGIDHVLEQVSSLEIGLYVASAGFGTAGEFADNPAGEELNMIDVNCRALAALAHTLARGMRERQRGGMIFMSSIVAFQGVANSANYAATKAYVQSLAEGLAGELSPYNIDVLASAPGPVATGFSTRADMQMNGATSPDIVAEATLAALGRRGTTRPGFQSKLLGYGLGILPRTMRTSILTGVMSGMIKHRNATEKS